MRIYFVADEASHSLVKSVQYVRGHKRCVAEKSHFFTFTLFVGVLCVEKDFTCLSAFECFVSFIHIPF